MKDYKIIPVLQHAQVEAVALLAKEIWNQHFITILSQAQIDYMVAKFQSYDALNNQLAQGYEYFQIYYKNEFVGYTGIHQEGEHLFLSKLYLKKEARGQHLSSHTFHYLLFLCKQRDIKRIWLTCNKYNEHTLKVYYHLGFEQFDTQTADIGNGYVMDDYLLEYHVTADSLQHLPPFLLT